MHLTLATLTLASALIAPSPQQQITAETHQEARQSDATRASDRMESNLGFTIYEPQNVSIHDLLRYASELTNDKVKYFYTDPISGVMQGGSRRRFIFMGDVIGVQDFEEGRNAGVAVLLDIDTRLGAVNNDDSVQSKSSQTQIRTVRLRTLDMQTARSLVTNLSPELSYSLINETGTIVLRGPLEAVAIAESLLLEVDQPLPQVTLRCALIKAVDADGTASDDMMNDEVAQSLARLLPGKRFRKVGELLLRGSAGGNAQFSVTSNLPGLGLQPANASIPPARVTFKATARGLEPKTKTLTLDDFSMELQIPSVQITSSGQGVTQASFAGYNTQGLRADLALRAGETTVVGSLGGEQIYVSLTFEIEE